MEIEPQDEGKVVWATWLVVDHLWSALACCGHRWLAVASYGLSWLDVVGYWPATAGYGWLGEATARGVGLCPTMAS